MNKGYFGIGVYHPKTTTNIGTLWRSAYLFAADFIFTIGRRYSHQPSDTPKTPRQIPLYNYVDYQDFINHLPDKAKIVCVEMDKKSRKLKEYVHPKQAIYLLGAEDYGIPEEILKGKQTIQIETKQPQSLNVSTAGSIVMYDRFTK